jgi:hypothetical protein
LVLHYTEDDRPSLGASFDWRGSLAWADANRNLISDRAYAGFCLTIIAPQAAKSGGRAAFFPLLKAALRGGTPSFLHLAFYIMVWLVPMRRRQIWRSMMHQQANLIGKNSTAN